MLDLNGHLIVDTPSLPALPVVVNVNHAFNGPENPYLIDPITAPSGSVFNIDTQGGACYMAVGTGYSNAYDWTGYVFHIKTLTNTSFVCYVKADLTLGISASSSCTVVSGSATGSAFLVSFPTVFGE